MTAARLTALLLLLALAAPAAAQSPAAPGQGNPFDYTPAEPGAAEEKPKPSLIVNPDEVEVSTHPTRGIIYTPRNAWRLWIERSIYIGLLNVALIAALFFIPKKDEQNLIIAYFMAGVTLTMNFWLFLCGLLFIKLGRPYWLHTIPASALMAGATYAAIMRIKKADISMSEVKSVFARAGDGATDPALAGVDGSPGSWPDEDVLR